MNMKTTRIILALVTGLCIYNAVQLATLRSRVEALQFRISISSQVRHDMGNRLSALEHSATPTTNATAH